MVRPVKSIICFVLVLTLCMGLAACASAGKGSETLPGAKQEDTKPEDTKPEDTKPEDTKPEDTNPIEKDPEEHGRSSAEAFFNGAAFIGDSVTLKLRNYNSDTGALYNPTFLCMGSYSVAHAVNNTMYLSYQGSDTTPQAALAACGAQRVFILLGMNDIALWGIDQTMQNWATLVANIRSTCPNIEIYIESGTPIYKSGEVGSLNNANMDKYNVRLQAFARENGCHYVDVNTPFKDSSNGLAEKYCSDAYVHFTDTACKLWVDILMKEVG